jgi:medium-chain acyl-[acyl-carrier-protein] hydrolase
MMNTSIVNPWLSHWQPKRLSHLRLFCFPYAGGGASIFRTWSEGFPPEIEVCPVQLPGRENRLMETPFTSLPELVERLADELLPYLNRPFAFFGHSMGALISFELARYLRAKGYGSPVHLFVSGHRAPQLPDPDPPSYGLPDAAFIEELRRLKGTPEEVLDNNELLHLLFPLLRADFALCETYRYTHENPLNCPISAFSGLQDSEAPRESVLLWREQTCKYFVLHCFAGDHFFLHEEQASLLQIISSALLKELQLLL